MSEDNEEKEDSVQPIGMDVAKIVADWQWRFRTAINSPKHQKRLLEGQKKADKEKQRTLLDRATSRGVPLGEPIRRVVISTNPVATPALLALRKALMGRTSGVPLIVLLAGSVGVGKTSALARVVALHALSAAYVRASDYCSAAGNWRRESIEQLAKSVDLLAIDELGAEGSPRAIVELLVQRFDEGKATILAGNLDSDVVGERYYDRAIDSRVTREQRTPWLIEVAGEDLRGKQ